MYDGPNYNPPDVQRHAPGQPPWVQQQAKIMHDGAAWQAYQRRRSDQEIDYAAVHEAVRRRWDWLAGLEDDADPQVQAARALRRQRTVTFIRIWLGNSVVGLALRPWLRKWSEKV